MERKRISINDHETDYVAYDNGTIFDERSRCFVDILFKSLDNGRAYSVPRVELWYRGEKFLYVLKDLIASLFLENPYPDYKPNIGYVSEDISDNSVNNIFYIPPCLELKKLDSDYITEQERKRQILEEKRAKRAELLEMYRKRREERLRKIEEKKRRILERVPLVCKMLIEGYTDRAIYNQVDIPPAIITAIRYQGAFPEIATKYGITPDNPPLPSPPQYVYRICERILDGFPSSAIAVELGVSPTIVKNIRNRGSWSHIAKLYGIKPPQVDMWWKTDEEIKQKIIDLYKENMDITSKEIANTLNIEYSMSFAGWCSQLKDWIRRHTGEKKVSNHLRKEEKI